ncbi:mandelate racemase/muconate lactonizing enzyme family protein [Pseudogemmobacter sonorensis]|uniref:mandelate racemase/muconate lactonizing enzyme family protein n=1 Tax=Pseudogemmobacter sonorensis TaxID=2989681 RepID=UPI0036913563
MVPALYRKMLTYAGLTVHTASSGPVAGLDSLYVEIADGDLLAQGETRLNCAYLNGYSTETLLAAARALRDGLDWSRAPEELRARVAASAAPAPVRMAYDIALWDLSAKRAGLPLAHLLADEARALSWATNQTLFLSSEAQFDAQVAAYVRRGFRDLKVRVGKDIAADCARIARLRDRYGDGVTLAADANGAWEPDEAAANLARLAPFDLAYLEQPIPPGDWPALVRLAGAAPMPLMLDESMAALSDVEALVRHAPAAGGRLCGHLKLLKLGGLTPALEAVRALDAGGIPCMIGQMNEGGLATAAALHLAVAARPAFAELYGADGLTNDPAEGLTYAEGRVSLPARPGLGLTFRAPSAPISQGE